MANPSLANDLFYALEAAQEAFPTRISDEFVVMGHSEGGGAAWGAAERQAVRPVPGYLGTVSASPSADVAGIVGFALSLGLTAISGGVLQAWSMLDIFPDFRLSDILSPLGVARLELLAELGGCNSVTAVLLSDQTDALFQPGWYENYYIQSYWGLSSAGGKEVAGPMLVIQGTADQAVPEPVTTMTKNETCAAYPDSNLEYMVVNGTTHVPTLYATQKKWLAWIKARFDGTPVDGGCRTTVMQPWLPIEQYQAEVNWFMDWAIDTYELA